MNTFIGKEIILDKEYCNILHKAMNNIELADNYDTDNFISQFDNGYYAEITINEGADIMYIDAILYNNQGTELSSLVEETSLVGEYSFNFNNDTYIVNITTD